MFIDPLWNFKHTWANDCQHDSIFVAQHTSYPPHDAATCLSVWTPQLLTLENRHHIKRTDNSIGYAKMRSLAKIQKKTYIYLHFIGYWASYLSYFIFVFFPLYPLLPTWNFWWVWEGRMCLPLKTKYFVSSCTSSHLLYDACWLDCSQYDVADTVFL